MLRLVFLQSVVVQYLARLASFDVTIFENRFSRVHINLILLTHRFPFVPSFKFIDYKLSDFLKFLILICYDFLNRFVSVNCDLFLTIATIKTVEADLLVRSSPI